MKSDNVFVLGKDNVLVLKKDNVLVLKKDNVLVLTKDNVLVLKQDNVLALKKDNVLVLGRTMYWDQGTGVPGYQGRTKTHKVPIFQSFYRKPPSDFHEMSSF